MLSALVDGQSATTIAGASFVSITTVRSQIRSVLQKLHVNSQLEAVRGGQALRLVSRRVVADDPLLVTLKL